MTLGCSKAIHVGTVWTPSREAKKAHPGATDYMIAVRLNLCRDPLPLDRSHFALVEFDDRPGVLQVHAWQELKVIN
jgi:hypothetical protein